MEVTDDRYWFDGTIDRSALDELVALHADEGFWTPLVAVVCASCRRRRGPAPGGGTRPVRGRRA